LCIAALLFLSRDAVLRSIELPLAYVVWAARVAAAAVGQRIVWAALVVVLAGFGLGSLRAKGAARRRSTALFRREGSRTRITFWETNLARSQGSWLSRQLLVAELRRLALLVLAHTEGTEAPRLERALDRGETDLPSCIQELFKRERLQEPRRGTFLSRLSRRSGYHDEIMDERHAAQIVSALEERLSSVAETRKTER
jgi:hypothetical protein